MTSNESLIDLERGLPTTQADIEALRRARRSPPMSPSEYLRFLSSLTVSMKALRERRGPRGPEPFQL
jgi:hypothetical protein